MTVDERIQLAGRISLEIEKRKDAELGNRLRELLAAGIDKASDSDLLQAQQLLNKSLEHRVGVRRP